MKLSKFREILAMVGAVVKTSGSSVGRCRVPSFFGVLIEGAALGTLQITAVGMGGNHITVLHSLGDEQVPKGKTIVCYTALSRVLSSRTFKEGEISLSFEKVKGGSGRASHALVMTQSDLMKIEAPVVAKIPPFEYADQCDLSHLIDRISEADRRMQMTFNRQQLAQALTFVMPYAATSDVRYYLCSACLNIRVDKTNMGRAIGSYFSLMAAVEIVTTDGHRMGVQRLEAELNHFDTEDRSIAMRDNLSSSIGENVMLPRVMAGYLAEWLSKPGGADIVTMDYSVEDIVDFDFAVNGLHVRVQMQTIDGKFPDYRRVLCKPEINTVTITLRRSSLERHLRMLNALYFDRAKYFGVKLEAVDGQLTVSAPQDKERLNTLSIPYTAEFHEPCEMDYRAGFNLHYLLAVLATDKKTEFSIRMSPTDGNAAIEYQALNGFCIIMAMRL